jgi:hypothetical protein
MALHCLANQGLSAQRPRIGSALFSYAVDTLLTVSRACRAALPRGQRRIQKARFWTSVILVRPTDGRLLGSDSSRPTEPSACLHSTAKPPCKSR